MKYFNIFESVHLLGIKEERISLHVSLQYVFGEDVRWHLHITVDEFTTAQELRSAWGKIAQAEQNLKEYQGSDPKIFSIALLHELESERNNVSYLTLSRDLNFDAIVYLLWAADKRKDESYRSADFILFVNLFHAMGIKNDELQTWEQQGRDNLNEGKIPWGLNDGPIERERIIFALKQNRKRINNGTIVIKPDYDTKYLDKFRQISIVESYWLKANDMLREQRSDDYKKYINRYNKRVSSILIAMGNPGSKNP